jgi:hypothetical protein
MLHIPVSRWGEPYRSLDIDKVVHFATGEPVAEVSQANGGPGQLPPSIRPETFDTREPVPFVVSLGRRGDNETTRRPLASSCALRSRWIAWRS